MPAPVLGIDLGTTNSVVAVTDGRTVRVLENEEGETLTPSVVSFAASGEVLVGQAARERRIVDAGNTVFSIKRLLGLPFLNQEVRQAQRRFPFELVEGPNGSILVKVRDKTYSLPEISGYVLRTVRAAAEKELGESCQDAVVTVPANFNELQRTATRDAARIAGLNVARIINEPTAAALAYGAKNKLNERIAVYDLGGGTFDISFLELTDEVFQVVATAGDSYLGGDDIDALIADRMAEEFALEHAVDLKANAHSYERLRMAAEWLKCELSSQQEAEVRLERIASRKKGVPLDLAFELTRKELAQMAYPLLGRSFDICNDALRMADLRTDQFHKVILVGGSTYSPQVHSMVAEFFGKEPLTEVDANHVVAQGAALQGHSLAQARERRAVATARTMLAEPSPQERTEEAEDAPQRLPRKTTAEAVPPGLPRKTAEEAAKERELALETAFLPEAEEAPPSPKGKPALPKDRTVLMNGKLPPPRPEKPAPGEDEDMFSLPPEEASFAEMEGMPGLPPARPPGRDRSEPAAGADGLEFDFDFDVDLDAPEQTPATGKKGAAPGATGRGMPAVPGRKSPGVVPAQAGSSRGKAGARRAARAGEETEPLTIRSPLLVDVTPRALGIVTAGGYCHEIIERNAPIPAAESDIFTTSRDNQTNVRVVIYQGEGHTIRENQDLGSVELIKLTRAPRGQVKINVTFMIDENGMLGVKAEDMSTGKEQSIRISLNAQLGDKEIKQARQRQSAAG